MKKIILMAMLASILGTACTVGIGTGIGIGSGFSIGGGVSQSIGGNKEKKEATKVVEKDTKVQESESSK